MWIQQISLPLALFASLVASGCSRDKTEKLDLRAPDSIGSTIECADRLATLASDYSAIGIDTQDYRVADETFIYNDRTFRLSYRSRDTFRLSWCKGGEFREIRFGAIEVFFRRWEGELPDRQFGLVLSFTGSTAYRYDQLFVIDCSGLEPTIAMTTYLDVWHREPDGIDVREVTHPYFRTMMVRDTIFSFRMRLDDDDEESTHVPPPWSLQFDSTGRFYFQGRAYFDTVFIHEADGERLRKIISDSLPLIKRREESYFGT